MDSAVDFDMTRQEFIDKMTPEEKKELADYKAKVACAIRREREDRKPEQQPAAGTRADMKAVTRTAPAQAG